MMRPTDAVPESLAVPAGSSASAVPAASAAFVASTAPVATAGYRSWSETLRALREARGITQEGWAARLGVSRKTVQRWESGERVPDPGAEAAILLYCQEAGLLHAFSRGPLAGLDLTEASLRDLFAEARWQSAAPISGPSVGPSAAPEVAQRPQPPANLPAFLTSFVGREQELATVRRVQAGTRLLTLLGAGGCGKTRLALALADELQWAYPHGVWFVDLAPLAERALLPQVIATALAIRTTEQQPPAATLVEALRPQRLLLLLDNCEHLLPECTVLVETLLRSCPHLEVLATSRELLGIPGETVWRVPPLTVPAVAAATPDAKPGSGVAEGATDAERLFLARARLQRPEFVPTLEEAACIAEICRRLDGMPLAIELAAARTGVLSVGQIATRLDDRFRLLTSSARAALPRQHTLRAAMDWSYDLLSAPERVVLRALSVFAGDFSLEAAESVCTGAPEPLEAYAAGPSADGSATVEEADVLDVLARLVDKSLVLADDQDGVVRYRLLETVRQYASERLEQHGEASRVRAAHATYFLELAERASPAMFGADQARWHAYVEREHDNLRAAIAWLVQQEDATAALRFASALRWFWYRRRHWDEGFTWPARALALPEAQAPTHLRADVLEGAGLFAMWRDPAAAQAMWEESISIHLQHGYLGATAQTHVFLAWLFIRLWRLDEAHARAEAALSLADAAGDTGRRAIALALLASVAARRGEHAIARARYEEAFSLRQASGDVSGRSLLLLDMAKAALLAGDPASAHARAEAALRTAREAGISQAVVEELRLIAHAALAQGDLDTAETRVAELMAHVRGRGSRTEADALALWGQVAEASEDLTRAASLYREALELARRLPDPGELQPVLYRDIGDQPGVALALEGAARLCAPAAPALALRLAGAAGALRARTRQPLTASARIALDRSLETARQALGATQVEQIWASGRAEAIENAMALALETLASTSH